jgi:hypothetical protein
MGMDNFYFLFSLQLIFPLLGFFIAANADMCWWPRKKHNCTKFVRFLKVFKNTLVICSLIHPSLLPSLVNHLWVVLSYCKKKIIKRLKKKKKATTTWCQDWLFFFSCWYIWWNIYEPLLLVQMLFLHYTVTVICIFKRLPTNI